MSHRVFCLMAVLAGLLLSARCAGAEEPARQLEGTGETPPSADEAAQTTLRTGGVTHGSPEGGLAAFLLAGSTQFAVGEPISLTYGVLCVELPAGFEEQARGVEVASVLEAVDPHNGSWFSVIGPDGQELPYRGEFVSWKANQPKSSLWKGELVGKTSDLNSSFDLSQPGKYRVLWHYGWDGPGLVSNELEIEVVPAAAGEPPAAAAAVAVENAAAEAVPPEVRILTGRHTTFDNIPFASFSCDIRNPGQAPLMFVGYRPDSYDPPIPEGNVAPIYGIEVQRNGAWEEYPIGWCGTGMGGIVLAPDGSGAFGFAVLLEPQWDAVRVGVRWSQPIDFETATGEAYQTAWSEPFKLADVREAVAATEAAQASVDLPAEAARIPHGAEVGGLAAFLFPQRTRFAVNEQISLSYGVVCVAAPANTGAADQIPGIEILKPRRAVDPNNLSWFTVVGPDGQELEYQGFFVSWPAFPEGDIRLGEGDFVGGTSSLNPPEFDFSMFDLSRPGEYRLRWHYGWGGIELVSNEVAIEIVAAAAANETPPEVPASVDAQADAAPIAHGAEVGGLAAFLIPPPKPFKLNETISLAHGVVCLAAPTDAVAAGQPPGIEIVKPREAVDPRNVSWFTVVGPDGQELTYQGFYVEFGGTLPGAAVRLVEADFVGTNSSLNYPEFNFSMFDFSRPGEYRLRWHYGGAGGVLVSNEVPIEIVP